MQINEAMFLGSAGWIVKPQKMRKGEETGEAEGKIKFVGEIVGISSRNFSVSGEDNSTDIW